MDTMPTKAQMDETARRNKRAMRWIGGGLVAAALGVTAAVVLSGPSASALAPATEFGYGDYTVGQDVAAGTWRAAPPALGDPTLCRWTLTRNGVVVDVARVGNEMPDRVVTLIDGDEFEATPTCGDWALVV